MMNPALQAADSSMGVKALIPSPLMPPSRDICTVEVPCHVRGRTLVIPPFRILLNRSTYISANEIEIGLDAVAPGRYRVLAVHNFHVEDCNPRLDECVAGVFLAARREDGRWEEPERYPIECRALQLIAEIDLPAGTAPVLTTFR